MRKCVPHGLLGCRYTQQLHRHGTHGISSISLMKIWRMKSDVCDNETGSDIFVYIKCLANAPENRPSQKASSIESIDFQVLCWFQGGYDFYIFWLGGISPVSWTSLCTTFLLDKHSQFPSREFDSLSLEACECLQKKTWIWKIRGPSRGVQQNTIPI